MIFSSLLLGGSQWRVSITKHLDSDDIKYTSYEAKPPTFMLTKDYFLYTLEHIIFSWLFV